MNFLLKINILKSVNHLSSHQKLLKIKNKIKEYKAWKIEQNS